MLLVVTYSREARTALRNACRTHEDCVVRRFGRAALLEATEFGAFQALRLQAKHGADVQVERVEPFVPERDVPDRVRTAAATYADRDRPSTPYAKFATGRDLPDPDAMKDSEL
ncbi:hypothetical protein BRC81_06585 [Halobacteriales archaeon QS_1_68_20]|nr:MAG: hypothetical protein BRC81_06585 [Halobacteriales archaeon QS_1_68_20]